MYWILCNNKERNFCINWSVNFTREYKILQFFLTVFLWNRQMKHALSCSFKIQVTVCKHVHKFQWVWVSIHKILFLGTFKVEQLPCESSSAKHMTVQWLQLLILIFQKYPQWQANFGVIFLILYQNSTLPLLKTCVPDLTISCIRMFPMNSVFLLKLKLAELFI